MMPLVGGGGMPLQRFLIGAGISPKRSQERLSPPEGYPILTVYAVWILQAEQKENPNTVLTNQQEEALQWVSNNSYFSFSVS
jgi:hypothetical protein